jgi:[ribosomal protein S18]-alanine N-acetyltransferase
MNTTGKIFCELPSSEVINLDKAYFPRPWKDSQWDRLDSSLNKLFTWRVDHNLLGFALFGITPGDDTVHLLKILTDPIFRGSSVAMDFWKALIYELTLIGMRSVYLEVETTNLRAIKFYQKCGFTTLRLNKSYYSDGKDALIMILTL